MFLKYPLPVGWVLWKHKPGHLLSHALVKSNNDTWAFLDPFLFLDNTYHFMTNFMTIIFLSNSIFLRFLRLWQFNLMVTWFKAQVKIWVVSWDGTLHQHWDSTGDMGRGHHLGCWRTGPRYFPQSQLLVFLFRLWACVRLLLQASSEPFGEERGYSSINIHRENLDLSLFIRLIVCKVRKGSRILTFILLLVWGRRASFRSSQISDLGAFLIVNIRELLGSRGRDVFSISKWAKCITDRRISSEGFHWGENLIKGEMLYYVVANRWPLSWARLCLSPPFC